MSASSARVAGRVGGAVAAVLVATLVVAGCGISVQSRADRADPDDVPFGLLEPPVAPAPASTGGSVTVYLVGEGHLLPVARSTEGPSPTLAEVLDVLGEGPTEPERQLGIGSALPPDQIGAVSSSRGTALVDLRASFAELRGRDQTFAIGQVVYTLTGQPGIGNVTFTLAGEGIEVPRGDGSLTTDPLARDDFDDLAPNG